MKTDKEKRPLRLLWNSNAPWSISGYGNQMAELLPLVQKQGHQQAVIDFYGLEGGKLLINDILHYPKMSHVYGSDAMVHHGKDYNPDYTFTLQDIWVLNPEDLKQVKKWIPVCPIDHEPIPKIILDRLKLAYRIITYSKFGHEELKKAGLNSTYIPHTVDTEIFKPMDKKQRKKDVHLPEDSFIVGMIAANKDNPPRKSFQEAMDAFAVFLKSVPNAYLYLHTFPDFPGGFPIKEYANFLNISERVLYPDPYQMNFNTDKAKMALIYNTLDVMLLPSRSEGFGVPVIEAQSCGVPVIVNDFVSMPELLVEHETGEVCDVLHKQFDGILSYNAIPSPESIYDCLMCIYKTDRTEMGVNARKFIVDNYDTNKVFREKWIPFLKLLQEERDNQVT